MDTSPSLETVLQALNALYRNPDATGKEKASVWLGELQRSLWAWQISDQLLQINHDVESCYFAAQTMRTKIQYSFHEVPADSHQALRESLMNHCSKITIETPAVIATQLCLALADLSLHMVTWPNAAGELIQRFSADAAHTHFLVELLTVLPEEINSRSLRLGANRRTECTNELQQNAAFMLHLLANMFGSNADERLQAKIFRCLGSWFHLGALPDVHVTTSPLLAALFQCLGNHETPSHLHEAASDCVCSALYACEDDGKAPVANPPQPCIAEALFQGVMTLPDAYHMSVAMEDIDKSINYCRVFTEMAETFLDKIVEQPGQGFGDLRTLELLLTCVGHHQYEVADITFNFWYQISEMLFQKNSDERSAIFRPFVQRLLVGLCRHCRLDPDHDGVPSQVDEFGDFRKRVSDLIKDMVFIIGPSACFSQMFECLRTQSSNASWDESEAALFVMSAVAKDLPSSEHEIVSQVVQAVLVLPDHTHVAVRFASTILIGELSDWIDQHTQFLEPVLQFLLNSLQQPKLATVAASALQSICSQCSEHLGSHFAGLLQIVEAVDSFNVSNDAAIGLLKGAALILATLPRDQITSGLKRLCCVQTTPLNKLLDANVSSDRSERGKSHDPTVWLDRLAAIFRHTNPKVPAGEPHPCQPAIEEAWPVLSRACDKYQGDIKIIERCCRCIRFAVRCLGRNSAQLLAPLVQQIVALYQQHLHSCFLYLGSILVDEYGEEEGCVQGLLEMLQAFSGPAFKQLNEQNGMRNHPDTVDDLFRLFLRFVQRSPIVLLNCAVISSVIACGLSACSLDHREANASVMKFFVELIKSAADKDSPRSEELIPLASSIVRENGQALSTALITSCVFHLPSYMMPEVAEVLWEAVNLDSQLVATWLGATLKGLPTEGAGGSATATAKQLEDFHSTVIRADDCKTISRALREFTRLYR